MRLLRSARVGFRYARIALWLLVLAAVLVILYLHLVGLPEFAQRPILEGLHRRGLDLQFERIRLVWYKGIVADNVSLQPIAGQNPPRFDCEEVAVNLNGSAMFRLKLAVESLALRNGILTAPWLDASGSPQDLCVTNVSALVGFDAGDEIRVDDLQGEAAGCHVRLVGTIAHFTALTEWKLFEARQTAENRADPVRRLAEILDQFKFVGPPRIRLSFSIDGARPEAIRFDLDVRADEITSAWAEASSADLNVRLSRADGATNSMAEVALSAARASSRFGTAEDVRIRTVMSCLPSEACLLGGRLNVSASRLDTPWFGVGDLELAWQCDQVPTNLVSLAGSGDFRAGTLSAEMGLIKGVDAMIKVQPFHGEYSWLPGVPLPVFLPLSLLSIDLEARLSSVESALMRTGDIGLALQWRPPMLSLSNFTAQLYGGSFGGDAQADLGTRVVSFQARTDCNVPELAPALPHDAAWWLAQFQAASPPEVQCEGSIAFPVWNPKVLRWPGDIRPGLALDGYGVGKDGQFKGIDVSSVSVHFMYSNMTWVVPELHIERTEGAVEVQHRHDERTSEFFWRANGVVDPEGMWTLMTPGQRDVLSQIELGGPVRVQAEVRGQNRHPERIHVNAQLVLTNSVIRGEHFDKVRGRLDYTNSVLRVENGFARRDDLTLECPSVVFDFQNRTAMLSHAESTVDPMVIARVIGPGVARAVAPYHYTKPPRIEAHGVVPLGHPDKADLWFNVQGGPFEWWRLKMRRLDGRVHWQGDQVTLTNMLMTAYDGDGGGFMHFDFRYKTNANFNLQLSVSNMDVEPLVRDTFQTTNHLEGRLDGAVVITNALTSDFGSWFGYGSAELSDGLIWDIPIFGVISPIIDGFVPGLGKNKATAAKGTFVITNSVIRSEDLDIQASGMRVGYRGTVDFQGNVDARVEAYFLEDTAIVGPVVSAMLIPVTKLFEYEVKGTLSAPAVRPLYVVPRMLLAPLNPLKLLRGLFTPRKIEPRLGDEGGDAPTDPDQTPPQP